MKKVPHQDLLKCNTHDKLPARDRPLLHSPAPTLSRQRFLGLLSMKAAAQQTMYSLLAATKASASHPQTLVQQHHHYHPPPRAMHAVSGTSAVPGWQTASQEAMHSNTVLDYTRSVACCSTSNNDIIRWERQHPKHQHACKLRCPSAAAAPAMMPGSHSARAAAVRAHTNQACMCSHPQAMIPPTAVAAAHSHCAQDPMSRPPRQNHGQQKGLTELITTHLLTP